MKLTRIIEQQTSAAPYYDMGRDFFSFTHAMNSATEQVKNRFEQVISAKIKGKKIRARASRGYKQFEKDYEINVANVSIDDYYDNYVVVVKGNNNKEYFLKPGFKVQIIGPMEAENPEQPKQPPFDPEKNKINEPQPPAQQQASSQVPTQQPKPADQSMNEHDKVKEPGIIRTYPSEKIEKDLQHWLVPLLPNRNLNLKKFIPRDGVSRTSGRKTVSSYGVTIPVDEVPALTIDQIKQQLSSIYKFPDSVNDIQTLYKLDKFDVRGDKYVIILNKITNY